MSVFDQLRAEPSSLDEIAYSSSHKMPPAPTHKVQDMRIVQRHLRSTRVEQVLTMKPNTLEEQTAPEKDTIDMIHLELETYSATRCRAKDLALLQPTSSKLIHR